MAMEGHVWFRWLQKGRPVREEAPFLAKDAARLRQQAPDSLRVLLPLAPLDLRLQCARPVRRSAEAVIEQEWRTLPPERWPHSLPHAEEVLALHAEDLWRQAWEWRRETEW